MRMLAGVWLGLLALPVAHAETSPWVGNYRLGAGHVVGVAEWEVEPGSPPLLVFTDFRTGRIGVLQGTGEHERALPAGLLTGQPVARLRPLRSQGRVIGLAIAETGSPPRRAERIEDRSRDVTVRSGSATLRGTLWVPGGRGPFPAIAIVPAGASSRLAASPFIRFFLSEGFAVLAYDRRSESADFPTYAGDAVAAAEALARQPEVNARRVGLWGHSQGGWLSLIAAARSRRIAFVIDHSGMLVPAWEQELYRVEAEATADSVPRETVIEAVAFETKLMRVAATGKGWGEIDDRLALSPAPAWHALVYKPRTLAELQRVWRRDFSFDPRPHVKGVRQPVLALFGGLDRSTPIESAAHLVRAVGPGGKVQIVFFPTANHAFLDARTGGPREIPALSRFAPAMFDTMRSWLARR